MTVYYFTFSVVAFLSFLYCFLSGYQKVVIGRYTVYDENKKRVYLTASIMFILGFIGAIRGETVGTDLVNYVPRYYSIAGTDWGNLIYFKESWGFEWGFVIFCKLLSLLFPSNIQPFLIVTSTITIYGFYKFIAKFSKIPELSIFIFITYGYWSNSFNTVRQYIAIGLLSWAFVCWQEKNKIKALIITILAISIHASSVVFLLVFFLDKIKFSKKAFQVILIITIIIFLIPRSFLTTLLSFTSYFWYADRTGSGLSILIVLISIFILTYIMKSRIRKFDDKIDLWLWMLGIAIISNVMALEIGLFERIMRFFLISLFVIIPDISYTFRKRVGNIIIYSSVMLAFGLFYFLVLLSTPESSGNVIPYYTFWENYI